MAEGNVKIGPGYKKTGQTAREVTVDRKASPRRASSSSAEVRANQPQRSSAPTRANQSQSSSVKGQTNQIQRKSPPVQGRQSQRGPAPVQAAQRGPAPAKAAQKRNAPVPGWQSQGGDVTVRMPAVSDQQYIGKSQAMPMPPKSRASFTAYDKPYAPLAA